MIIRCSRVYKDSFVSFLIIELKQERKNAYKISDTHGRKRSWRTLREQRDLASVCVYVGIQVKNKQKF